MLSFKQTCLKIPIIAYLFIYSSLHCSNGCNYSHIYSQSRPASCYLFTTGEIQYLDPCNECQKLTLAPLFYNTYNDECFSRYFMINRQKKMLVAGSQSSNYVKRDIDPTILGCSSSTDESLSLVFSENAFAIKGSWLIALGRFFNSSFMKNFILGFRTSIIHKVNETRTLPHEGVTESCVNNFFANITDHTKILPGKHSNFGIESLNITLESLYKSPRERLKLYYYTGLSIPIPWNEKDQDYMNAPVLGNNNHLGLVLGAQAYGIFCSYKHGDIGCFVELENNFLIYRTHHVTFDLYKNQWSRYLPAVNLLTGDTSLRIGDVLTIPVRVHPCFTIDLSVGPRITLKKDDDAQMHLALGYNLWYTADDYIEFMDYLKCKPYQNITYYGILGSDSSHTASQSTIRGISANDATPVALNINDLDIDSPVRKGGIANTLFARCVVISDVYEGVVGCWIEDGNKKGIQSRYGVWGGFSYKW